MKNIFFRSLIIGLLGFWLLPSQARAVESDVYCQTAVTAPFFQPASAANPCPVVLKAGTALIGAIDTAGSIEVTPTVQNAQYVSTNDIGGLVSFVLPRTASGLIQSVAIQFIGGATTTINAFCFDSNPSASTFTDKSTFTIAAADEAKRINKTAIGLTPAAATGDSVTGAEQNQYAMPFNSTATIYCAYASTGTFTPASVTDMRVSIRYIQGAQ